MINQVILGDCAEKLREIEANCISAVIADPPAGISFMNQKWDSLKGGPWLWIEWLCGKMRECLRVLKPGAYGLVWALPKTSHRTAIALEMAGFIIKDIVYHMFGSGFPKNHDISKAIDKAAGAERESIGIRDTKKGNKGQGNDFLTENSRQRIIDITAPATDDAKKWNGWGTALKPCIEHWILVQKPKSEKTIAKNVLMWGTGGMNIDGCRVPMDGKDNNLRPMATNKKNTKSIFGTDKNQIISDCGNHNSKGRWPAQLIHDGSQEIMAEFEKYGESKSCGGTAKHSAAIKKNKVYGKMDEFLTTNINDQGSIARFFYCAKESASAKKARAEIAITHPTVKSIALMKYLITLITPPGGIILDPFGGSGSTAIAAKILRFPFIIIEKEKKFYDMIVKSLENVEVHPELFDAVEIQQEIYRQGKL